MNNSCNLKFYRLACQIIVNSKRNFNKSSYNLDGTFKLVDLLHIKFDSCVTSLTNNLS